MISESQSTAIMIRHTFQRNRVSLIWWSIAVALYTVINVAVYPAFKDSILLQTQNYPQGLIDAFGLDNLDQLGPYIYSQVFLMLPLVLAFLPVMMYAGAFAGAEERGALDVLLTQPIRRRSLVLATFVTAIVNVAIVLIVTALATWLTVIAISEKLSFGDIMLASWSVLPVTIAVSSIGLLLSTSLRSRGPVLGASIGIIFLLYLIDVVGRLAPDFAKLRYISPFRYFNDVFSYDIPVWYYLLLLGVAVVLLGISIRIFERRDIFT